MNEFRNPIIGLGYDENSAKTRKAEAKNLGPF